MDSNITTKPIASLYGNYLLNIESLTLKPAGGVQDNTETSENTVLTPVSPLVIYSPFIIFFGLFIGILLANIIQRVINLRRIVTVVIFSLMAAVTPFLAGQLQNSVQYQSKAVQDQTPRNIEVISLTKTSVIISWETNVPNVGAVRFGQSQKDGQNLRVIIADNGSSISRHTVKIDQLVPGSEYIFEIASSNHWYDLSGSPVSFTTSR
jgi:hypothetical protein